jgi:hypothetical protein
VRSNLLKQMPGWMKGVFGLLSGSPAKGAKTPVYLATSPEVSKTSGKFFSNAKEEKLTSGEVNDTAAQKLWDISMSLAKLN